MARKKLGIGSIEINKKFKDKEEAYRYAKRLIEHIRYVCKKNAKKGWYAQAMVVVSNLKKDASRLKYENSGKRGRPRKRLEINENIAYGWYKGEYKTDWHLHILLVSKPSYMFRNEIKDYVDKNWIEVPKIYEVEPFDLSKLNKKKVYKKYCNIKMSDYFIWQCEDVLFCNCNFGEEEKLKYSLRDYHNEYLKVDSAKRRLYAKHRANPMSEDKYLKALEKIESRFNLIEKYYLNMTREKDNKENEEYMGRAQSSQNSNKEQAIHHSRIDDNSSF